ncbi:MAG: biopolymer transporter ExbD [Ottowia sp.]|nr:biopolymer transporter ExbD [Ottowia sp.]
MPVTSYRRSRAINEINMVPFIDVMLVLLIIFMVTASLITPGIIDVPHAGASSRPPDQRIDILIDASGGYALAGEVQREGLAEGDVMAVVQEQLEKQPDLPVMIAADSQLRYEQVMSMMKALREAGVQRIGLSVKD